MGVERLRVNGIKFGDIPEAKEVFLTHFPDVTEKDLDTELGKLFKDDIDKSDNTEEKVSDSDGANTEVDNGGTEKKSSGRNKPR